MGGLFSRAFKRITQGNQQTTKSDRNESDHHSDSATRDAKRPVRSLVESIPVGQSIDSAEYRALEGNKNVPCIQQPQQQQQQQQQKAADNKENTLIRKKEDEKKKDVEEAVIKIQALVRGHLTRKALKDANQPANGQLGQSQFDEESLTKTPLSAIFSPSSLINTVGQLRLSQQPEQINPASSINRDTQQQQLNIDSRLPLESIAEVVETTAASIGASVQQTAKELADYIAEQENKAAAAVIDDEKEEQNNDNRGKLAAIVQSIAGNNKQISSDGLSGIVASSPSGRSDSSAVSPVPSEANASIDLNTCDTPASASIDILDHNIRPTDRLAAVLHLQQQQQQRQQQRQDASVAVTYTTDSGNRVQIPVQVTTTTTNSDDDNETTTATKRDEICTPDSLDSSEEAAAIRIQSAFRGYRTRKNSPYRTRSPNSINDNNNKRDAILRQQEAVIVNDDDDDDDLNDESRRRLTDRESAEQEEDEEALEAKKQRAAHKDGRRESRSKQRADLIDAGKLSLADSKVSTVTTVESISGGGEGEEAAAVSVSDEADTATIKEVPLKQQNVDDGSRLHYDDDDSLKTEGEHTNQGPSLYLGLSELADTLDEAAPVSHSAALEAPSSSSISLAREPHQSTDQCLVTKPCRTSIVGAGPGVKSTNDTFSFDTDSSVLGAALSLDDEVSTFDVTTTTTTGDLRPNTTTTTKQTLTTTPEESSETENGAEADDELTIELESEARRLVEELEKDDEDGEREDDDDDDEKDQHHRSQDDDDVDRQEKDKEEDLVDEATNQLEAALDEATTNSIDDDQNHEPSSSSMNEEKQSTIELESDDIERRDPRGQASEERARSPQISTEETIEPIELVLATNDDDHPMEEPQNGQPQHEENDQDDEMMNKDDEQNLIIDDTEAQEEEIVEATESGGQLMVENTDFHNTSGRSSPAIEGSSNGEDSDDNQKQQQQQSQANRNSPSGGSAQNKNKKRNRNKKRAKK